jgi:hypothetical protein
MPAVSFRRVVTGHNADGKAVVSMDGMPPNVRSFASLPGVYFSEVWNTSESPTSVDNGTDPTLSVTGIKPPASGSLIRVVDIPPEQGSVINPQTAKAHFTEIGSADASTSGRASGHGLMHRTETLDYGIVLEGSLTLVLDDSEVELKQGDIVIQRGTNHAWCNRSGKRCRMAFILLDGRYSPEIRSALEMMEGQ